MTAKAAATNSAAPASEADLRQRRAADPDQWVCVDASAGTGKTRVLTNRVLRLLLPRPDGRPGTPPSRILCLTYTKAAAAEMLSRIGKVLGEWAVASDGKLTESLAYLSGRTPTEAEIAAARRLFAAVSDSPGGLKIMTIHSFCQSVLARFPLEVGLGPQFSVIEDDRARRLLAAARDDVLIHARAQPLSPIAVAINMLGLRQNAQQFEDMLAGVVRERRQFHQTAADPETLRARICRLAGLPAEATADGILGRACADDSFDRAGLYEACRALGSSKNDNDRGRGHAIQMWLDAAPEHRAGSIESYIDIFITKTGDIRKQLATKPVVQAHPEAIAALEREALRLAALNDAFRTVECADLTRALALAGAAVLETYSTLKQRRGALDFEDLTLKTLSLLEQPGTAPWVLYKLDGGLDHILVDEAQDTNPEQWRIIDHLCREFYSGRGSREDITRTAFVVGDEKQSIFSFQRAAPAEFARMKGHFAAMAGAREEQLRISFRSVPAVLRLVDEVFRPAPCRKGLNAANSMPEHISHRREDGGLAEIWPLAEPDDAPEEPPWDPPVTIAESRSGSLKLAEQIAATIAGWIAGGERLESKNRPIRPGDILVVVRTRTALVNQLVRALKTRGLPVSGVDRMVLGDQIAVMDLLAAAQFALLPADDLTLACVLRSPLAGLSEEALMSLAVRREGTLWQTLKTAPEHRHITAWLAALLPRAATLPPYEFFSDILQNPCPGSATSGLHALQGRLGVEALDPLQELLNAAVAFENDNPPSLQLFLLRQQGDDSQLKRELEEAGSAIRIMTVHGAKGLQAPVVILPDTVHTASSRRMMGQLLWPNRTGLEVPLFSSGNKHAALFQAARERVAQTMDDEYRRLLYVALTRAEDRLYIAGYRGKTAPMEDCWYNMASAAFERFGDAVVLENGGRRISCPQTGKPDENKTAPRHSDPAAPPPPAWLREAAALESPLARPLTPSRPEDAAPAARSPLETEDGFRFQRGVITHKLLQFLPDLPPAQRRSAAQRYLAEPVHGLLEAIAASILTETMAILEHPDLAPLFGTGSMAEVPVTGIVDGRAVSAQIDRLLVTPEQALIIDYKTNRPPPQREEDVDPLYRRQLGAYRQIIAGIYPGRRIRTFLLWTDGPRLMELGKL